MTSSDDEPQSRPRDLGLTVASAFFHNQSHKKCESAEEKRLLLDSWSRKEEQIRNLYEHFEQEISCSLQRETGLLVKELVGYVRNQSGSTAGSESSSVANHFRLGYIPAAVVRHGFRMTDRDAVFDLIEVGLRDCVHAAQVVRMDPSHTTDMECMKRKIMADVMTPAMLDMMTGKEKVRKAHEQRLPFKYFAHSYAATTASKNRLRPVVLMIEHLEKAEASALTALFSVIKNNMQDMRFLVILGCCTNCLSLQQLLPAKAYDMLFVKTFQTASAAVMFAQVVNEIFVSSNAYSFKLGPRSLKLLQDNFEKYNYSLEKILSIVKLMIMKHVRDNPLSVLSVISSDSLESLLKHMSTKQLKQLRSDIEKLPSIESSAEDIKRISVKDTHSFCEFIKRSLNQMHECHKNYVQAMRFYSFMKSATLGYERKDEERMKGGKVGLNAGKEKQSLTPPDSVVIRIDGECSVTESSEFKNMLRSLSRLTLKRQRKILASYINNSNVASDSSLGQMLTHEYSNLLQFETDAVSTNNEPEKRESRNPFEDCKNSCKNLRDLQAILGKSMSNGSAGASNSRETRNSSKFQTLSNDFASNVRQFFASLTPPFSLPLSEVVYFNDSSFVADHYFASARTEIIESLRRPLNRSSNESNDINDDEKEAQLDAARIYQQIASSSVSISMFDLMECLKSQKDTALDPASDDPSPRKKAKKNKDSAQRLSCRNDVAERHRFFTLINDMEYIGIIQKDKRKTGRLTKLVWEAE